MKLDYYSDFKNFTFPIPFRTEEEGEPSVNKNFNGKDGWIVSDPKKSIEYLKSLPEDKIEKIDYRDTGIVQHFKTKDKEIVFFKAVKYQDNTCRPYSLIRNDVHCPFCGRKTNSLEETEFYLNDEFISKMALCPDCTKLVKDVAEKDDFSKNFIDFVKNLSENWEKGTKDNVKVGSVVKILELRDEPIMSLLNKDSGTVTYIDDAGQIHGTWSGLAIIPEVDSFLVLKEDKGRNAYGRP